MQTDDRVTAAPTVPTTVMEPRHDTGASVLGPYVAGYDRGTTSASSMGRPNSPTALWNDRWTHWRNGFSQTIGPRVTKYYRRYRAFDDMPRYGPGQEWRDRTIVPEDFKIIETILPARVLSQWGSRVNFEVEGVDSRDTNYEELVRVLIQSELDAIGAREPQRGTFISRMIDALRYREIMGHVFFKVWWRHEDRWIKKREQAADGSWSVVERLIPIYDGVDIDWLPLSHIAMDLSGARRWIIERVKTSVETLTAQDKAHFEATGTHLYDQTALLALQMQRSRGDTSGTSETDEPLNEPANTEGWPLDDSATTGDPLHTGVELWLCWDNVAGTLTKIVDRTLVLDHGFMPTPDGLDPYVSSAAIPVPGQPYGESRIHWSGSLTDYQTKLVRARGDEILLNIFQQHMSKQGSVISNQFFFEPGGMLEIIDDGSGTPIDRYVTTLPRRPVFTEAWTEEQYRQSQAEACVGADAISSGVEATQKSREVTAAEIGTRERGASSRVTLAVTYDELMTKRPILLKVFDLLRLNLTTARSIRVLNRDITVDLRDLESPIDIKVGGGIFQIARAERASQVTHLIELAQIPAFAPYFKPAALLQEVLKNDDWKDPHRFIRTDEELAAQGAPPSAAGGQPGVAIPTGGPPGLGGTSPEPTPPQPGPMVEDIE